eukprot:CAMPEP_0195518894 /NCGR_PEP_ID=MMETSP0794_2-20130614/13873_1 /TAXON_ID=515487 /ORGANISM="Stephanopyxis turris, Strain CCMP 815" /LENGTH=156 /DNA_ID=CAMNT_0040647931 /DNA_START=274 /DNA_END=744 /DNA_ORIENTATION=+
MRTGNRKKDKKHSSAPRILPKEFQCRCEDLKGYVYDVASTKGGSTYTRTTQEIARHVGGKYSQIGTYIHSALLMLVVPNLPQPAEPEPITVGDNKAEVTNVQQEIWKEQIRLWVKMDAGIKSTIKSVYDLIWGQCSEMLRSRLRGDKKFTQYSMLA